MTGHGGRTSLPAAAFAFALLAASIFPPFADAASTLCRPGMVMRDGRVIPLAMPFSQARASVPRSVKLRYVAHSSFLITGPEGGRLLTDPYANPPVVPVPDAVTVSNFHMTHSQTGPYEGKTEILYGLNRAGGAVVLDRVKP